MAGELIITALGNLTADPELRSTQQGLPVVSFTIAQTPRVYDRQTQQQKDGEPVFLRCTAWREFAEHIAGSLTKGMRVLATGELKQRSYQDRDGQNRMSTELDVHAIGPDLRWATAQVTRVSASAGQPAQRGAHGGPDWGAVNQPAREQSGVSQEWVTAQPGGGQKQYGDDTPW